jgi:hypothetical protein
MKKVSLARTRLGRGDNGGGQPSAERRSIQPESLDGAANRRVLPEGEVRALRPSKGRPMRQEDHADLVAFLEPVRRKRAKTHRGSRRRDVRAAFWKPDIRQQLWPPIQNVPKPVAIGRGPYTSTHDPKAEIRRDRLRDGAPIQSRLLRLPKRNRSKWPKNARNVVWSPFWLLMW